MAGGILALILALIAGGLLWLLLESRFRFAEAPGRNAFYNLLAYSALCLPFAFVLVFFGLERL